MPSSSVIELAKIRLYFKISSCICSMISGEVTVLGRPGRGSSQVRKSPRLKRTTEFFLRWHTMVHVLLMFLSEWRNFFVALRCGGKIPRWQLASSCCWNRALRLTCFLSASVTRKYLQFGTWRVPSFQRHYRFRLRYREIVRSNYLSAPRHNLSHHSHKHVIPTKLCENTNLLI